MENRGSPTSQERILYIDILRWFGIALVYLGHFLDKLISSGYGQFLWLHNFIYSFHIPLFFFLSGIFWKAGDRSIRNLGRRASSLLIPALFWSFVYLPFSLPASSQQELMSRLAKYPLGHFYFYQPSWFLVCLFTVEVILSVSSRILNRKGILPRLAVIVSAFLIGTIVNTFQPFLQGILGVEESIWYIGEAFTAMGFFLTGSFLKDQLDKNRNGNLRSALILLLSIHLMIFTLRLNLGNGADGTHLYVDMSRGQYGNYFWFVITAFLGIASSIILIRLLNIRSKLLQFIGENSIVFYGLNGFNIFVLDNFVIELGLVPQSTIPALIFSMGYVIVSQLVLLPLALLLVRYSPLLVGRYKFSKPSPGQVQERALK